MKKKIFISYRSIERDIVKTFIEEVKAFGDYDIWWDGLLLPGQSWWDTILDNLETADIVIVMLSRAYLDSEPCQLEHKHAEESKRPIIPIRIDSKLQDRDTKEFALLQYTDYLDNPDDKKKRKKALENIKKALEETGLRKRPIPMPNRPDAPISPIVDFRISVSKKTLSHDEQFRLVTDLQRYQKQNSKEQADIDALFEVFLERNDISKEAHDLINANPGVGCINIIFPIAIVIALVGSLFLIQQFDILPNSSNANATAIQDAMNTSEAQTEIAFAENETQRALDTIALQTQAIVEANETQNALDTLTADAVATQDAINTSETQTAVAQATQDVINSATDDAQANLDAVATQNAISTVAAVAIFNEQATQAVIDTATADALAIIDANETQNAIGTADAQATIDALAIQNTIGTADAQATLDALATQAILNAQATQNNIATANALASQSANDTATAIAQMTLSAIPTNAATYTPSPTANPDDWQAIIQQLRGEAVIGTQGQLIFEEDRAFVQGQGSLYQSLASDTFVQNIVLSAEIRLESNSSEIEFCALQIRVQEDSPGIATTTVTVGLINDGRLFVDEFLDEAYISGKVESVSVDIEDNNHLMLVAVDNILTVYLNGEPIVQNHVIDEHDGTAGLSILGQSSDSRCEANNIWAYEVQ